MFTKLASAAGLARLGERFAAAAVAPTTTKQRKVADQVPANIAALCKAIYEELPTIVEVTNQELLSLAEARAKPVQRERSGADGIPPQQVSLPDPANAERWSAQAAGVIARLDLSAARQEAPDTESAYAKDASN